MSYEYNSESRRLDLPNPFKVENHFYFIAAGILVIAAIALLLVSRSALAAQMSFLSFLPLLIGIFLLIKGIDYARRALMQLRFFFGRGEPTGLAGEMNATDTGIGKGADALKETMRHNALVFREPEGALNGLLYSWIPNLIFAPLPIQTIAQRQFYNALAIVMILLSLLVSWVSFSNDHASAWMGLFFYSFSLFIIVKPLKSGAAGQSELGMKGLVGLVLVAIMGPVALPLISSGLPDISAVSLSLQTFVLLVLSLISIVLFFVALIRQMVPPPPTTAACEQQTISMNSHPKQLIDEMDRELQKNWTEQIPNRRYSKVLPEINSGGAGSFFSEVLEESQPMPNSELRNIDFTTANASPRYQWLVRLNIAGVLLTCAGVGFLIAFAVLLNPTAPDVTVISHLTLGAALLVLSNYCFSSGHALWGRFDFTSKLTWVEIQGNYQSAKMDYGNTLTDSIKTNKQIINIETMTLRVWVSELTTVSFGKNSQRWIIGMSGLPDQSSYLAKHLTQFAADQSIIVAPESNVDLQKINNLKAINHLGGSANAAIAESHIQAIALQASAQIERQTTCSQCNSEFAADDKFCGNCGEPCPA